MSGKNEYFLKLLKNEKTKLHEEMSPSKKVNLINNIIRIKKSVYTKNTYESQIYSDIKLWLTNYVKSLDEHDYSYDIFSKDTILKMISLVSSTKQTSLYYYLIRQLKIYSHTNDKVSWCESQIKKLEIKILWESCNIFNIFRLIFSISSYNLLMLLITSLIYIAILNIVFLPEEYIGIQLFTIEYEEYYKNNFILNHILNVTNYLFNFCNGSFKIIADSILDMIILILVKIIFYLLIINFMVKEVTRSLRKYE